MGNQAGELLVTLCRIGTDAVARSRLIPKEAIEIISRNAKVVRKFCGKV